MALSNNALKSRTALGFTVAAALAILGLAGWFTYLSASKAQLIQDQFSSLTTPLSDAVSEENIPELKAITARLYTQFPELKALSVTSEEGVVFFSSRHPSLQIPQDSQHLALPPLYLPESPWEQSFTHRLKSQDKQVILQFLATVYDRPTLLEYLKVMIFVLLGTLLVAMVVQLVLRGNEVPEGQDDQEAEEETAFEETERLIPDTDSPADLPDLGPLPDLQSENEEFWYQEDPVMSAETLTLPNRWETDDLPDLDLPPLETIQKDSIATDGSEKPPVLPYSPQKVTPFDPESGAVWEEFLESRLESEIRRAADHNQDLVMALVCAEDPLMTGEKKILRNLLVETFPLKDLIFNRGESGFTILLPQRTLDTAMTDLKLSLKRKEITNLSSRVVAGLSARSGRLLDQKTLTEEAEKALEKASSGHENLIGFKADPDKYRNFLAKSAKE